MALPFSTLATGVISISLVHSLVPHHWLPFVLVGRKQGWKHKKTLGLLFIGACVHMLSTVGVGLAVGYLGQELGSRIELLHGVLPGLILVGFGGGLVLSKFTHWHFHVTEKVAAPSLILMLGLSPCVVVAPFFILLGPLGIAAVIKVCVAMSLLSISGMVLLGWLAVNGLKAIKLQWLEENETLVMGALLMILGISAILTK